MSKDFEMQESLADLDTSLTELREVRYWVNDRGHNIRESAEKQKLLLETLSGLERAIALLRKRLVRDNGW